jgi:CubicO group peptidase (beta-lactamase class C family)
MVRRRAALALPVLTLAGAAGCVPPDPPPVDRVRFTPGRTLHPADPTAAGLRPDRLARLVPDAAAYLAPTPDHPDHPAYAGAVILAARNGIVALHAAVGSAVRYAEVAGKLVDLPAPQRIPMRPDTVFDIASLTKLFTSIAVLRQAERGAVALDAPVTRYLPEFAAGGKAAVTVRQLLTHTAGLPEDIELRHYQTRADALRAVLTAPLGRGLRPGGQFHYSDLGMISAGAIVERVTGRRLDSVVRTGIADPLGLSDTGYLPDAQRRDRTAATEYRPGIGVLRGAAHDEKVAPLGGVAGHAGIFSTALDLAILCQALLDGGRYGAVQVLREDTVRAMLTNENARFADQDHGLGVDLNKTWYMQGLASPVSFGHTGYTGTSVVADPRSATILVFLTNQVHPDRNWSTRAPAHNVPRRRMARDLDAALVRTGPGNIDLR